MRVFFLVAVVTSPHGSGPRGGELRRRTGACWVEQGRVDPGRRCTCRPAGPPGGPGCRIHRTPACGGAGVRGREWAPAPGELGEEAGAEEGRRAVDRGGEAGGQGLADGLVGGASLEPRQQERGQRRALRLGEGERGGLPAQRGQEDVGAGASGGSLRVLPLPLLLPLLLRYVSPRENRPPVVVPCRPGEPRSGDPAGTARLGLHGLTAPTQVARFLQPVEGRPERALPVDEGLGQRLHGDVGALGEAVDVRGDRRFAGWEVREVVGRAGVLAGGGALAVARVGHGVGARRVRVRVRGQGGNTKVGSSHGDRGAFDLVGQAPAGVGSTWRGLFRLRARYQHRHRAWQLERVKSTRRVGGWVEAHLPFLEKRARSWGLELRGGKSVAGVASVLFDQWALLRDGGTGG